MILDAPSPEDAIWRYPERSFPRQSPQASRAAGAARARRLATLGHPVAFFAIAAGLWSIPALAVSRIDPDRAVTDVVRCLERQPMLACLGFAVAAAYVVATALLLAVAGGRLTQTWSRAGRLAFRVVLAPAILLSLAAWVALAAGGFLAALLWVHAAWP